MKLQVQETTVQVRAGEVELEGILGLPEGATGLVLFAHGSGSSRHSSRNQFVARELAAGGVGFLLFDLLTAGEGDLDEVTGRLRFDIPLLAERVVQATDWVLQQRDLARLRIGYFGSSTGAAAGLIAAARRPDTTGAVVSRGGRPDLAADFLPRVQAPTLLIVGGDDAPVIRLNEQASRRMLAPVELQIIPGATHLFPEPGALDRVARLARDWFVRYL